MPAHDIPGEKIGALPTLAWSGPDVGDAVAITTTQGKMIVPFNCEIVEAQACADSIAGTADPYVDIRLGGTNTTILNAVMTIAAVDTMYPATPLATYQFMARGAVLDINVFTDSGGADYCKKPTVNLVLKRTDTSYPK